MFLLHYFILFYIIFSLISFNKIKMHINIDHLMWVQTRMSRFNHLSLFSEFNFLLLLLLLFRFWIRIVCKDDQMWRNISERIV